ncbi:lipopolysaccharide heptosyltransferase I [Nautilia sp.]
MKIAIVRLSSLGDIIKNASVVQMIKKHYPDSEITWVADSVFADILDNTEGLENIIKLDLKKLKKNFSFGKLKEELNKLPKKEFDVVIDSHGMLKAALVSKRISKGRVCGFDGIIKEKLSKLFYSENYGFGCWENEIYRYNKLAAMCLGYGFEPEEIQTIKPFLGVEDKDYSEYERFFEEKNIVLAFGASRGWECKKYPVEKWINVIKSVEACFLLIWGNEDEKKEAEYISSKTGAKILPKLSFNDLKYVIKRSDLIVGNDTGPSHIGWAVGTKSLILFGCTDTNLAVENEKHRLIKSASRVNRCKFIKSDLSIGGIDENTVIKTIKEMI